MIIRLKPKKDIMEWHKWFAWHPVHVGERTFAWLQYVERQGYQDSFWDAGGEYPCISYRHRLIK